MIKRYEGKKNVSGEFIKNARKEKKMSKTKISRILKEVEEDNKIVLFF